VGLSLLIAPVGARAEEWFDAYDRALQALKQKKATRAVELLERAIRMRPEPGTNIITYGTNRLDAYHPYLRLAEAHLLLGDAEAAAEALRRSETQGKEPAAERARLAAEVGAVQRSTAAAATPAPTPLPAAVAPGPAVPPPAPVATPPLAAASPVPLPAPVPTAPPGASVGTLELRTDPPGATALLGGRLLGATPLRLELAPGAYQVTLRKEGAADQTFPVRVTAGKTTSETRALVLTATPAPAPATTPAAVEGASLVVYSDPPGSAVYLDDEPIGETDPGSGRLVKSAVAPGPHRLRLARPGYSDLMQDLQVGASGPSTVRATLTAVPRGSGWVLAALVGVGALALSAGGWLILKRRGPADGTVVLPAGTPATTATRVRPQGALTPASRSTKVSPPTVDAEGGGLEGLLETRALPAAHAGSGERFGEYLLVEPLGKGGMATVFKAEKNGEHVALKRPLPAFLDDPEFLERFLREAQIGRTLHHPNIIRIFERGHVSGVPYFTMELVQGRTLQAHLREQGALGPKPATRVIAQVAEALDYAHLKGVFHRDLKPSNIMILEDGTVKVMDYGIARARRFSGLTVTGAFLGTPDYMAPEAVEGKADARSDLYALGVVFYEVLTGKKLFVADTPFGVIDKHRSEPPTPPSAVAPGCPRELEAVILRLLAKDPDERHPGAEELLIELREFLNRAA